MSLPKGGGALRSIGEKFAANPITGTASLSIPVAISPGRSGFQPTLALSYDSGAGNGAFGIGWSVGLPVVGRKTDQGIPRYGNDDTFTLGDDLVPALVDENGAWIADARNDGAFAIARYRPRIEGHFTRIERWTDQGTGDVHWVTRSRDNLTNVFGRTPGARLADPDDPRRVFQWFLEESRDERGNLIAYEYKADEQRRTVADAKCTQLYPKRIKYGNRTPFVASNWLFELVYDYGEHDSAVPTVGETPGMIWGVRPDVFSRFRSGFDVRTYRLCRRILMFHRFAELGETPCLVKSTDFHYDEAPTATRLTSVTVTGYIRTNAGYSSKSLPPIDLTYSEAVIDEQLDTVAGTDNLPVGLDQRDYQWIDLDGDGAAGVLARQGGSWFYKRNLGGGELGPLEAVGDIPSLAAGRHQLLDLGGDGRLDLVRFDRPVCGYQERVDGGWAPFLPFRAMPSIDWGDSNLRFIDLDGDGLADVLITEDELLRWYPSRGKEGFGEAEWVRKATDEDRGPALLFQDRSQSIVLADMTGDGLTDLVRVRNGSVCYWPNRGHGRFGARMTMTGAPRFAAPDQFDPRRIRLADIDGAGPADLIYLDHEGARVWFNQAGNSLSAPTELTRFPGVDSAASVEIVDLLGDGTPCLVWSSPLPGARMRYLRLMSRGKPYLLKSIINNLGGETELTYAPSTKFYLADRAAGRPWVTRLPFPVQVLEQTTQRDRITGHKFTSRYAYHHGDFDGDEREFRGFGMVEQWDSEVFDDFDDDETTNAAPRFHVPPVHTKTWFHTGGWKGEPETARQYATEYWGSGTTLPDTVLPVGLSPAEMREACRALRGRMLRSEVYADDGTLLAPNPYTVTESSHQIKRVQPTAGNDHAVFASYPAESMTFHYERMIDDPRVAHSFVLAIDAHGNVTRQASVGYPRKTPRYEEQGVTTITASESWFINQADRNDTYHLGVPYESKSWEVTGLAGSSASPITAADLEAVFLSAELAYEAAPDGATLQRRVLGHSRSWYLDDAAEASMMLGELGARKLVFESQRLALTTGLVATAYGGRVTDAMLTDEARYVAGDGGWWVRSGRQLPDTSMFYRPVREIDPFGLETSMLYDDYGLFTVRITDPIGNVISADYDYRVLAPTLTTDANGNRGAVAFDALGLVAAAAAMGKPGQGEGDTLDDPTRRIEYDLDAWRDRAEPAVVHVFVREQHGAANPRWQESYEYYDGGGRVVMGKVQAEPGPAPSRDADGALILDGGGKPILVETLTRWRGTGRTIVDNKGNAVKQYEPYFSSTSDYEDEVELVEQGVTPILRYDPLGRNVETKLPAGTSRRVVFDPWYQEDWDENDTVLDSDWYGDRSGLPGTDPEGRAAVLTAAHARTPTVVHLDARGRHFLTIRDGGALGTFETRVDLDVQGNPLAIVDARGIVTREQRFPPSGNAIYARSADAGEAWTLVDCAGKPIRVWRTGDLHLRHTYDGLRRFTHLYLTEGSGSERLVERTVYGEAHADPASFNLRGRTHLRIDGAGMVANEGYDFEGNLLHSSRRLCAAATVTTDWTILASSTVATDVVAAAEPLLDPEVFVVRSTYDAIGRAMTNTAPDGSITSTRYNEASLLETVAVNVRGDATATPIIVAAKYNARGQRESIDYGNGALTVYEHDPATSRTIGAVTTRDDGARLQDLTYTYDPAGNVLAVNDAAQATLFFANSVASASGEYEYDAIYRLTAATGREHAGGAKVGVTDPTLLPIPHVNDVAAAVRYREGYAYDGNGNIVTMTHVAGASGWTRSYDYASDSNRLIATSEPGDPVGGPYSARYSHDGRGSITAMPHLTRMTRDFRDQIASADLGGGGTAYYAYDAGNQRVRKVVQRLGAVTEERIYLGSYEVYRKRRSGVLEEERQTLHVSDQSRPVVLIETLTVEDGAPLAGATRMRYQIGNHLSSAVLELSGTAAIISYEEFHPYGTTAYHSEAGSEVSRKRYRYHGKEKDEESGLYYYGARYHAAWLGRWCSVDPVADAGAGYRFASNSPVTMTDPDGRQPVPYDERSLQLVAESYGRDLGLPLAHEMTVQPLSGGPKLRPDTTFVTGWRSTVTNGIESRGYILAEWKLPQGPFTPNQLFHDVPNAPTLSVEIRSASRAPEIGRLPGNRILGTYRVGRFGPPSDPFSPVFDIVEELAITRGTNNPLLIKEAASIAATSSPAPVLDSMYMSLPQAAETAAEAVPSTPTAAVSAVADAAPPRSAMVAVSEGLSAIGTVAKSRPVRETAEALLHGGIKGGSKALGPIGAAMTIWSLGEAAVESWDAGTPAPLAAQAVREGFSWAGAAIGAPIGAVTMAGAGTLSGAVIGSETGPFAVIPAFLGGAGGAAVGTVGGAMVGGLGGYALGDYIADSYIWVNK